MKLIQLRIARATRDIDQVLKFYRDGLGLEVLFQFEQHEGFAGVMLGKKGTPYHFEFTREDHPSATGAPSPENLTVFYLPDRADWQSAVDRLQAHGFAPVKSHNPYWDRNGVTFEDFEQYRVVLAHADWKP